MYDQGKIVSIVGANGAGKSTILRSISGLHRISSGEIWFQDKRIDGMPPSAIVKAGIAHIPENRMIFTQMTVLDNLKMGSYLRKDRLGILKDINNIYQHFPVLKEKQRQKAGSLSSGQQQMLAIARGLMANPRLLLMDEHSMGLSPLLVAEVARIIKDINKDGISIILVEQNDHMVLKLSGRAYVLEMGRIVLEGTPKELMENERVKGAYLGGG